MNSFFAACAVALALLLGACASPLQPQNYTERLASTWLASDRFTVTYRGTAPGNDTTVADLALLRSAEIALQQGFPYFIIVTTDAPQSADAGGQQAGTPATVAHDGRRYRLADPGRSNTIVGYREKPPGFAYVALFVKASLRAKYGLDQADS